MIFSIKGTIKIKSRNTTVEEITQRIQDGLIKNHAEVINTNEGNIKWHGPWIQWFTGNLSTNFFAGKEGTIRVTSNPPNEIHIKYNLSLFLSSILTFVLSLCLILIFLSKTISIIFVLIFIVVLIIAWVVNNVYFKHMHEGFLKRLIHDLDNKNV